MAESTNAPAAPTPPRPRSASLPGSSAVAPAPSQTEAAPAADVAPAESPAPAVEGPSEEEISEHAIESGSGRTMIVMHLGTARAEINPRAVQSHLARGFSLGEPAAETAEETSVSE